MGKSVEQRLREQLEKDGELTLFHLSPFRYDAYKKENYRILKYCYKGKEMHYVKIKSEKRKK